MQNPSQSPEACRPLRALVKGTCVSNRGRKLETLAGVLKTMCKPPPPTGASTRCVSVMLTAGLLSACATQPSIDEPVEPTIVFVSQRSGDGDIYAIDPDSGAVSPLITTPASEGGAIWDAERNRIVYQVFGDDGTELRSDGRRVMGDPSAEAPPSWSPDGRYLVYSAKRDSNENLYLATVDGSSERRLTDGPYTDRYPVFSPDGQSVAFARRDTRGWDLFVVSLTTREERRLTNDGEYVGHPSWSAEGRSLVFDRTYDGQADIASVDVQTGELRRLTERLGNDLKPVYLPDGRVVFAADVDSRNEWDLWILDTATGELRQLTETPGFDGGPVYAPRSAWRHLTEAF
ncbi:MAG: hypothetical protein AAF917_02995 [Pseudomonadota bacterium]